MTTESHEYRICKTLEASTGTLWLLKSMVWQRIKAHHAVEEEVAQQPEELVAGLLRGRDEQLDEGRHFLAAGLDAQTVFDLDPDHAPTDIGRRFL